jgi:hypothetical protein
VPVPEAFASERLQRPSRHHGVSSESGRCKESTQESEQVACAAVIVHLEPARGPRLLNEFRTHASARDCGDDSADRGWTVDRHRATEDVEGQVIRSTDHGSDFAAKRSDLLGAVEAMHLEPQRARRCGAGHWVTLSDGKGVIGR